MKQERAKWESEGGQGSVWGGDIRLLPALVVHKVVGPNGVQFCVRLVPNLTFEDFGLVDEGPVITEHAFVHSEGWC